MYIIFLLSETEEVISISETEKQTAERERAMAKAMAMAVLFKPTHYWAIVDNLENKGKDKNDFKAKCAAAGLDNDDQEWLYNYLVKYNKLLAQGSDKKWPIKTAAGAAW